ncbi:hypothetical protein GPLA_0956 [Paraglaciecola polaris LMG 21857]|uniref:Uncharacterized protein n=1 Tax=Paraglaciecola polaris LMG 21857 TaxID=1129793 RepID=K6ZNL1_9ALTE|nr:hypothetical protein GPLA_0956 [Paraglaciecola polaris LMG 21857]
MNIWLIAVTNRQPIFIISSVHKRILGQKNATFEVCLYHSSIKCLDKFNVRKR